MRVLRVRFKNGKEAFYTDGILDTLMQDEDVAEIIVNQTGELLKWEEPEKCGDN